MTYNITNEAQRAFENRRVLYFEGAGWSGADISKATVGNCRIRTAFHLDDGRSVYLEIIACEVTRKNPPEAVKHLRYAGYVDYCHYIDGSDEGIVRKQFAPFEYNHTEILRLVNSLGASFDAIEVLPDLGGYRVHAPGGGYNFADEFTPDRDLIDARETADAFILAREKQITGRQYPAYSLWVDETDPACLHFNSHTGRTYDLYVAVPEDLAKLPTLSKSNAIPGCYYSFAGGATLLHRTYRISEEYAARNRLMHLDRAHTAAADFALPGSDLARWVNVQSSANV